MTPLHIAAVIFFGASGLVGLSVIITCWLNRDALAYGGEDVFGEMAESFHVDLNSRGGR